MRMRSAIRSLVVAAAVLGGAESAHANFVVTATKVTGSGAARLQGWDIYQLFVTNDGTNNTGNDVVGWDLTATNPIGVPAGSTAVNAAPFHFWNDGADYSPSGGQIYAQNNFTNATNIINSNGTGAIGSQSDFGDVDNPPGNQGNGSFLAVIGTGANGTKRYDPHQTYLLNGTVAPSDTSLAGPFKTSKTFRVAGAYSFQNAGFPADRLTGTLRFGNIIVPTGSGFTLTGGFKDNDQGSVSDAANQVSFSAGNVGVVPEPASLGLVGVGMLLLGRRKRRA